ncbi:PP2C family protein-serine/threonine phosphatase [Streptomyces sp. 8K308]|uniref:PP2C family protein-serine/threonine phosphatase n=1 Tax=Streptomyces sp. 8K308 TaxID=2530388 RepID=UPI001FB6C55B|nr:PP2C family protein-serine/threonine phosphatase [Streptomyces sp. 8K308]
MRPDGPGSSSRWQGRPLFTGEPTLRIGRWDVSWLLPSALLLVIAAADWNASGDFRVVTWLAAVPIVASATGGMLTTVIFAVLAPTAYVLLDLSWEHQNQMGVGDFALVVAGAALGVLSRWLRGRAHRHLMSVENAAEATRLAVLRPIPPLTGGLRTANAYLAADSAAQVGGDFFDVQPSPHGTRVLLGDVQGKGTSAVDAAAALLGTFREAGHHEGLLATVAERLEDRMRRENEYAARLGQREDRLATAILVGFPAVETGWVELVNFGHAGPLVIGRDGVRQLPEGSGAPLGLTALSGISDAGGEGAPSVGLPPVLRVPFERGETLLLVTDGVTEARDRAGEFLPLAEHLTARVAEAASSPDRLVALVERAVRRHTGGPLADDTAILAVRHA